MMVTMQGKTSAIATAPTRVLSIDVLRGITIAFMILVNDAGDGRNTYAQLDHAWWNGCTLTDLVFPTFLFIIGASIIFSIDSRIRRGETRRSLALHILRRSAIIFALDLFFALYPHFHYTHMRIYGVLTRIALCYLCASFICLFTQRAGRLFAIAAALLLGYWVLLRFVPVPGFGMPAHDVPFLDPDRNLSSWLDRGITDFLQRTIHTGRLYRQTRDPEGLLSTFPAIATTLLGAITALWLRRVRSQSITRKNEDAPAAPLLPKEASSRPEAASVAAAVEEPALSLPKGPPHFARTTVTISPSQCLTGLFLSGLLSAAAGLLWSLSFPLNKNLWTSSYVLFAAGCALIGLAVCYWLIDIRHLNETKVGKWLTWPWLVFGSNAIVAYCVSEFLVENLIWLKVPDNGKTITAWYWIYHHLFAFNGSTKNTSLAFALVYVALCFIPNWLLWRKRIFVKI
jgi:predicted acyltransferase